MQTSEIQLRAGRRPGSGSSPEGLWGAVAAALAVALAAGAVLATGDASAAAKSPGYATSAGGSLRLVEVRATPKRSTVDPGTKRVSYFLRATNVDAESSGVVRLCARTWPHGRLMLLGERCESFASLDPGVSVERQFKFRVRDRARGELSEIRLRAAALRSSRRRPRCCSR